MVAEALLASCEALFPCPVQQVSLFDYGAMSPVSNSSHGFCSSLQRRLILARILLSEAPFRARESKIAEFVFLC